MLENLQPVTRRTNCKVRTLYETLEPKDAVLLRQYIDDVENWAATPLSNALRERNVVVDPKVISRHRKNLCSCGE